MAWLWVAAFVLLGSVDGAAAQSRCNADKFKAGGKYVRSLAACRARAEKKGVPVDVACLDKAEAKRSKRWARAVRRGDCTASGEEGAARLALENRLAELQRLLKETPVCCEFPDVAWCAYLPEVACELAGWTVGPPASNCHPPSGTCGLVGVDPGPCCEFLTEFSAEPQCLAGPDLDGASCTEMDGTFSPAAGCAPAGGCQ
jgi:hypothetical protein